MYEALLAPVMTIGHIRLDLMLLAMGLSLSWCYLTVSQVGTSMMETSTLGALSSPVAL